MVVFKIISFDHLVAWTLESIVCIFPKGLWFKTNNGKTLKLCLKLIILPITVKVTLLKLNCS